MLAFRLECAIYERMNREKQFDEKTIILLAEIKLRPH